MGDEGGSMGGVGCGDGMAEKRGEAALKQAELMHVSQAQNHKLSCDVGSYTSGRKWFQFF